MDAKQLQRKIINEVYIPAFYGSASNREEYWEEVEKMKSPDESTINRLFNCRHRNYCQLKRSKLWRGQELYMGNSYGKEGIRIVVLALELPLGERSITTFKLSDKLNNWTKGAHWSYTLDIVKAVLESYYNKSLPKEKVQPYFSLIHACKCYPAEKDGFGKRNLFIQNCNFVIEKEIKILKPDLVIAQSFALKESIQFLKTSTSIKAIKVKGHRKGKDVFVKFELCKKDDFHIIIMPHPPRGWIGAGIKKADGLNAIKKLCKAI